MTSVKKKAQPPKIWPPTPSDDFRDLRLAIDELRFENEELRLKVAELTAYIKLLEK